jgi:deazaflavin-dependent oxidoreductase (nitroreductase family)
MSMKRSIVRNLQRYVVNPPARALARRGLLGDYVVLETIGRKSGQPRETPVGMKVDRDTAWMVSEHGHHASYVKNIEADARVRVRIGGQWRPGTAHLLDGDDPVARLHALWGNGGNTWPVRAMGTSLLSIRIDLERRPIEAG